MCCEVVTPHVDPVCSFDLAGSTPDAAPLTWTKSQKTEDPLYTEINIPLPTVPTPSKNAQQTLSPPTKSRSRAVSLSSLSPFRSRGSSTSSSGRASEEWPRIKKEVKNKEIAAMMNLNHQSKRNRSSTIDALAVVPAVLVLSAELFTPGQGEAERRRSRGGSRWEDGIR